jgi:hypothetical protein
MNQHRRAGILSTSLFAFLLCQPGCQGPEDELPFQTAETTETLEPPGR